MTRATVPLLERAPTAPVHDAQARELAELSPAELPPVLEAAAARREGAWGRRLTYSPKVFLPLTNLCRNHCDYCAFRRSSGQPGEWTMDHAQIEQWLEQGARQGAVEALLCLGDKPESAFAGYRKKLASWGHASTVDLIAHASERALAHGLLPHTNAGVLERDEIARLQATNVSLGLMLENVSSRLCEPGMPHHRARDKQPGVRLRMIRAAGSLRVPFTSGILIGIGETPLERVNTLLAIRAEHARFGHIQEVIVQNFRAKPEISMANAPEPEDYEVAHAVALARLILPDEVSIQAPPNLNPRATELLVRAGINDFGGISPVTPDYVNPGHPWPHLEALHDACAELGFELRPRLPIYERYVRDGWVAPGLADPVRQATLRLGTVRHPCELAAP